MDHEQWVKTVDDACGILEMHGCSGRRLRAMQWLYSTRLVSAVGRMVLRIRGAQ